MNSSLPLLLVAVFLAGLAAGVSRLALAKYLRDDLGASVFIVSSLTTWFMAARAVSSLVSGLGATASGRLWRLFLATPLLVVAVIVYIIPGAGGPPAILALNALWGFMSGLVWPQAQALASYSWKRSGTAIALYFTVGSLGISAGQFLYGVVPWSNADTVRASSLFFASSGALLAFLAWRGEPPVRPRRLTGSSLRDVLRMGGLAAWILLAAYAAGYSSGILKEFLYIYLGEVYGLSREALAAFLSGAGVVSLVVSFSVGPMSDRWGVGPVLLAVLAMGVAGHGMLGMGGPVGLALAGLVLAQASSRSSMPLTRNAAAFQSEYAVALVGASNTLSSAGQMTGPLIAGKLYDAFAGARVLGLPGESTPFLSAALPMLAVAVAYPLVASRPPAHGED